MQFTATIENDARDTFRLVKGKAAYLSGKSPDGEVQVALGANADEVAHFSVYVVSPTARVSHWRKLALYSGRVVDLLDEGARRKIVDYQIRRMRRDEVIALFDELGRHLMLERPPIEFNIVAPVAEGDVID